MPRRVKIESLTVQHGPQYLEESVPGELRELSVVYVDLQRGQVFGGQRGNKVSDLQENVIEVPRATWH